MSFDVGFILGLDDRQFKQALDASESTASKTLGKVGLFLKAQTEGFERFQRGINNVVGTVASLATGFGLFAAVSGAVSAVEGWYATIREHTEAEARARREISESVERTGNALREQSSSSFSRQIGGVTEQANAARAALGIQRNQDNATLGGMVSRGELTMEAWDRIIASYIPKFEEIDALEKSLIDKIKIEAALRDAISGLTQEQRAAQAAGDQEQADRIGALIDYNTQLGVIEKARETLGDAEVERRKRAEAEIYEQRLARIDAEAQVRRNAFAEEEKNRKAADQREQKAKEEATFRAALDEDAMEVEKLRLEGKERESKILAEQLDHRRKIHEIETREGLSDADRVRLTDKENDLEKLRLKALDAEKSGDRQSRTLGIGFGGDARLAMQVLGSGNSLATVQKQLAERSAKAAEESKNILQNIKKLLERPPAPTWARFA